MPSGWPTAGRLPGSISGGSWKAPCPPPRPAESCAPLCMAKYLPQRTAPFPVSALSPAPCSRPPRSTVLRPYGAPGPKETPPPTPCLAGTPRATARTGPEPTTMSAWEKEKGAVGATQQGVGGRPPAGQTPGFWRPGPSGGPHASRPILPWTQARTVGGGLRLGREEDSGSGDGVWKRQR